MLNVSETTELQGSVPRLSGSVPYSTIEILELSGSVPYSTGLRIQSAVHSERVAGKRADTLIALEHRAVYTLGRSASRNHLIWNAERRAHEGIEVVETDRGGDITYHGPGQLVVYPIVKLTDRGLGVREYVTLLEEAVIQTLASFGIAAGRDDRNRGVWVGNAKICAIGIRVSRQTTLHGLALNVNTNLAHFDGIVPCGLSDADVTSMAEELSRKISMRTVKTELLSALSTTVNKLSTTRH